MVNHICSTNDFRTIDLTFTRFTYDLLDLRQAKLGSIISKSLVNRVNTG